MAERTRRPSPPGAVQRDFEEKTLGEQVADLSEDVLESVRDRQQTVIEAMRKFVDRLDEALPDLGEERRKKVLDALVDFAEKLGTTTNEFAAKMVRSASATLLSVVTALFVVRGFLRHVRPAPHSDHDQRDRDRHP